MPVVNPDHLLDQADRLIAPPARGAPRQADLRRAISSAYYAVFHAIVTQTADDLVGTTSRASPLYELVYRSIDHRSLRRVCEDISKPTPPQRYARYVPEGRFDRAMIALATEVIDLQDKRYSADYDPLFRARTSDAELAVATGRSALTRFRHAPRKPRSVFLYFLAFSPRTIGRRRDQLGAPLDD